MVVSQIKSGDCTKVFHWGSLVKRGVPLQQANNLSRGAAILDRDLEILSGKGLQLKDELLDFGNRLSSHADSKETVLNHAMSLDAALPRIEKPHLELFNPPRPEPFRIFDRDCKELVISLLDHCLNACTFCLFDVPESGRTMEFVRILKIAEAAESSGVEIEFDAEHIDPFHYSDAAWGADFGDVHLATRSAQPDSHSRSYQTHGAPPWHEYAYSAYRKLHDAGEEISRVSVHLFHKEFNGPEKPEEADLARYARQFIDAITYLRPYHIVVRGFDSEHEKGNPRWLALDHAKQFFLDRVYPELPPDLKQRYSEGHVQYADTCWVRDSAPLASGWRSVYGGFNYQRYIEFGVLPDSRFLYFPRRTYPEMPETETSLW